MRTIGFRGKVSSIGKSGLSWELPIKTSINLKSPTRRIQLLFHNSDTGFLALDEIVDGTSGKTVRDA